MRRVFLAGAGGAVGRPLCRLLRADGFHVVGTTRLAAKAGDLAALGIEPVVVDVLDAAALRGAVVRAKPDIVIHQLTDLPPGLDPARMAAARVRNARLREEGTANLAAAALAAGATRMIAQSIAFAYAEGPLPYAEDAPRDPAMPSVVSLEQQVLALPFDGLVLRYGYFYGPGTGFDAPPRDGAVHVDAAADAARRAITRGAPGIYNIAEGEATFDSAKARRELGWSADFRL